MTNGSGTPDAERRRLAEADAGTVPWRRWGPYLSERQWAPSAVREDCSAGGDAWFPMNILLIRALLNLHAHHGPGFTVECPTGSGRRLSLYEVAREISDRLTATFLPVTDGHRPVHGGRSVFAEDPHWKNLVLIYEYFHGDNGTGLGAGHQTGWTGQVAATATLFHAISEEDWQRGGRESLS